MTSEPDVGDYVPFSGLRAFDVGPKMAITRHLLDGLATIIESTEEQCALSEVLPASIALLVETVQSLEAALLAVGERGGSDPSPTP